MQKMVLEGILSYVRWRIAGIICGLAHGVMAFLYLIPRRRNSSILEIVRITREVLVAIMSGLFLKIMIKISGSAPTMVGLIAMIPKAKRLSIISTMKTFQPV